jgi:hypothetical protein
MSANNFIVSAAPESSRFVAPATIVVVCGPLLAAVAAAASDRVSLGGYKQAATVLVCLFMMLLWNTIRKQKRPGASQVSVTVYPVGVQLARFSSGQPVRPPMFIPRDVILDVIVNEVILSHKVVSVVLFRVWKQDGMEQTPDTDRPPIASLLKEGRIHLIPAFPGVELSFRECQIMRRELSVSLGLA